MNLIRSNLQGEMPPWPNLSFKDNDWQDPLRSFNEFGMGGLNKDVYGGGAGPSGTGRHQNSTREGARRLHGRGTFCARLADRKGVALKS